MSDHFWVLLNGLQAFREDNDVAELSSGDLLPISVPVAVPTSLEDHLNRHVDDARVSWHFALVVWRRPYRFRDHREV